MNKQTAIKNLSSNLSSLFLRLATSVMVIVLTGIIVGMVNILP